MIAPREVADKAIDLSGSNEFPALLDQRAEIMAGINVYEARKNEIETQIKFALRDCERAIGIPGWSITWKTSHRQEYVMKAKDIRTLRINRTGDR
jgi:predicted phage-related endonuclease